MLPTIQTKDAVIGIVKRNPKGFCFVNVEEEDKVFDIFIPPDFCKTNYTGDKVKVIYSVQDDGRLQGQIIETLEENRIFYGIVKEMNGIKYCISDMDQFILKDQGYELNHILKIRISPKFQSYKVFWVSEVEKDFGDIHSEFVYQRVALDKFGIQQSFNKMCKKQLTELLEQENKPAHYTKDMTALNFFTIDSESTKDIDDALCYEKIKDGHILHIAIANVATYIKPNSALDKTAKERVSTLYLPGLNVPLYPRELSENLFSLNPMQHRQAVVCTLVFNSAFTLISSTFTCAIIQSKQRLSYEQVDYLIQTELYWQEFYDFIKAIRTDGLFDRTNYGIITDEKGFMTQLSEEHSTPSQQIVETAMLLYNQKTAELISLKRDDQDLSQGIFRIQKHPEADELLKMRDMFAFWGIELDITQFSYDSLKQFIETHKESEHQELILSSIMKTLPKSEYTSNAESHFSLNFEKYAQATSPIRRYIDLINQRQILNILSHQTYVLISNPHKEYLLHVAETLYQQNKLVNYVEGKLKLDYLTKQVEESNQIEKQYEMKVVNTAMKGIFVSVTEMDLQVFISMKELTQNGYTFNSQKICWEKENHILKIGNTFLAKISNLNHFSFPTILF